MGAAANAFFWSNVSSHFGHCLPPDWVFSPSNTTRDDVAVGFLGGRVRVFLGGINLPVLPKNVDTLTAVLGGLAESSYRADPALFLVLHDIAYFERAPCFVTRRRFGRLIGHGCEESARAHR